MATSKRDLSFLTGKSSREVATEAERAKREAEIEEMRRIRAERDGGGVETTRKRITLLEAKNGGQGLITDLDEWRAGQKDAQLADREGRRKATDTLHSFQNNNVKGSARKLRPEQPHHPSANNDNGGNGENDSVGDEEERSRRSADLQEAAVAVPAPPPGRPTTYSRFDVKFSFGLVVRNDDENGFGNEDLRDNKTLRKCMGSTASILMDKMPSPPEVEAVEASALPEAFYDPDVEPSVISIDEEKKEGKKAAKGTKRTLVKASFPVFLRDGTAGKTGTESSAKVLKDTKSTVFKALRAAVTGGSFLQ